MGDGGAEGSLVVESEGMLLLVGDVVGANEIEGASDGAGE